MLIGNYTWQNKKVSFLYVALKNLRNIFIFIDSLTDFSTVMISRDFLRHETKYLFFPSNWHIFFLVKDRYMMRSDSKKKCVVNNIPLKKIQNANDGNIVYCCMSNLLRSFSCNGLCYCCWNFSVFSTFKYLRAILWGPPS